VSNPFDGITLRFQWRWDGKKWTGMKVTAGTSDHHVGDGTATFLWGPMYGLMFTYLSLVGVDAGAAVGGNEYMLADAIRNAPHNRWANMLPGGFRMFRAMSQRVDRYLSELYEVGRE
jgi:hypothetical protein